MKALTFNGTSSNSLGLVAKSTGRMGLQNITDIFLPISGVDGSYFFKGDLEDKLITIDFSFAGKNFADLIGKFRQIAQWLDTNDFVQLVFDDEQDKYYLARVEGQITPEFADLLPIADFQVTFRCRPFAYHVEKYTWDSEVVKADNEVIYLTDFETKTVTGSGDSVFLPNFGLADALPMLTITGSFTTLSLTVNEQVMNFVQGVTNQTLVIDCEKGLVTKDGVNFNQYVTGDFFKLPTGRSVLSFTGTGLNFTFQITKLRPVST